MHAMIPLQAPLEALQRVPLGLCLWFLTLQSVHACTVRLSRN